MNYFSVIKTLHPSLGFMVTSDWMYYFSVMKTLHPSLGFMVISDWSENFWPGTNSKLKVDRNRTRITRASIWNNMRKIKAFEIEQLLFIFLSICRSQPCIQKFNSLMNSSSSFDITGLSHFVYYAMKMRESIECNWLFCYWFCYSIFFVKIYAIM